MIKEKQRVKYVRIEQYRDWNIPNSEFECAPVGIFHGFFQSAEGASNGESFHEPIAVVEMKDGRCGGFPVYRIQFI